MQRNHMRTILCDQLTSDRDFLVSDSTSRWAAARLLSASFGVAARRWHVGRCQTGVDVCGCLWASVGVCARRILHTITYYLMVIQVPLMASLIRALGLTGGTDVSHENEDQSIDIKTAQPFRAAAVSLWSGTFDTACCMTGHNNILFTALYVNESRISVVETSGLIHATSQQLAFPP